MHTSTKKTYNRRTCTKKHTPIYMYMATYRTYTLLGSSSKHTYMRTPSFLILLVPLLPVLGPLEAILHSLCNPTSLKYAT